MRTKGGLPRYLVRTAGKDSGFRALVAAPTSSSKALSLGGVAYLSLTIRNVLNASDTQKIPTDANGVIDTASASAAMTIPTDTYVVTVPSTSAGAPPVEVSLTPLNDGDDMGLILAPTAAMGYSLKASWIPESGVIGLPAPFMFSNGTSYSVEISIKNVGDTVTPTPISYAIAPAEGASLRVLTGDTTGTLNYQQPLPPGSEHSAEVTVALDSPPDPEAYFTDQKLAVTYYAGLQSQPAAELWTDYVSLRFYRLGAIISVKNGGSRVSGVLITPEGKGAKILGGTVKGVTYDIWPLVVPWMPGEYLIGMVSNDYLGLAASPTYGYSIGVNTAPPAVPTAETADASDTPDAAATLGNYSTATGYVSTVSDADYFKIDLTKTGTGQASFEPHIIMKLDSIKLNSNSSGTGTWDPYWSASDLPYTEPTVSFPTHWSETYCYAFSFTIENESPDYLKEVSLSCATAATLWPPYVPNNNRVDARSSAKLVAKSGAMTSAGELRIDLKYDTPAPLVFQFAAQGPDIAYSTMNIYRYSLQVGSR